MSLGIEWHMLSSHFLRISVKNRKNPSWKSTLSNVFRTWHACLDCALRSLIVRCVAWSTEAHATQRVTRCHHASHAVVAGWSLRTFSREKWLLVYFFIFNKMVMKHHFFGLEKKISNSLALKSNTTVINNFQMSTLFSLDLVMEPPQINTLKSCYCHR